MATITNIPKFNFGPNMGGAVASFLFIDVNDVEYIPPAVSGNITADIILKSGASWKTGAGVYQGNAFNEQQVDGGNDPDYWSVSFNGKIPQRNAPTTALFGVMIHYRFLMLVTDANGFVWLLGHPDYEGLKFSTDINTGANAASFNGHQFSFTGKMPYPAPSYKGNYVVNPGDCPVVTIAALSGNLLTVPAGNTIQLSDVLTEAPVSDIDDALTPDSKRASMFDALINDYGGYWPYTTLQGFGSGVLSTVDMFVNGNDLYVLSFSASSYAQIYNLLTGSFRTKSSLGNQAYTIRKNPGGATYLVAARVSNAIYIIRLSDDVTTATLTAALVTAATFANSGNIFWNASTSTVTEITNTGTPVGSSFSVANVGRIRALKNEPGTNRIWAVGDSGSSSIGRISYFDATSRAITDVNITGSIYTVGVIAGIAFYNGLYYLTCQINSGAIMALITINLSGVVQSERSIPTILTTVAGIASYGNYPKPVIVFPSGQKLGAAIF